MVVCALPPPQVPRPHAIADIVEPSTRHCMSACDTITLKCFLSLFVREMHHYSTCDIPLQDDKKCIFERGQQGSKLQ